MQIIKAGAAMPPEAMDAEMPMEESKWAEANENTSDPHERKASIS